MAVRDTAVDLAVGVAAGLVATRVTDRAQRALYRLTPPSEKAREPDFPQGSSAMVAAQKTAGLLDVEPDEDGLKALKSAIHYGLGLGWGALYGLLRRHSQMTPIGAGTVTGGPVPTHRPYAIAVAARTIPDAASAVADRRNGPKRLAFGADTGEKP
jgi:hypothetical protein